METLLLLSYIALCIVAFKVFKIPLNKWTVPTAVLGGVFLIGFILLFMNYNHPYSEATREYFVTTPIIPDVSGTVVEVHAQPNIPIASGDPLFQIDPVPFQAKLNALSARAKQAEADFERAAKLIRTNAISQENFERAQSTFDDLSAQLEQAEYDLERTTVRAPADGFVAQEFLRPGMRAVAMPLRPVMVFVPRETIYYTGFFRQNSLLRLEAGHEAEIAFDGVPGQVFTAEVVKVARALREGQLQPSGQMVSLRDSPFPGRVPVVMKITDPAFDDVRDRIPGGAYGQAAVYSEHAEAFAIIRKILLRMASWMNYVFPMH